MVPFGTEVHSVSSKSKLMSSGGACWSVQTIHWLSKGRADRQADRHMGGQEDRLNRERQGHHGPNYYNHDTTGWHSERSGLGSLLHVLSRKIVERFVFPRLDDCFRLHCQGGC